MFGDLLSASIIKAMLTRTKPFTKLELGLLIAATVLVPVTKPGYILFIPLLFLIPNSKFSSRQKALLYKGLLFAATAVLFLAWTKASSGTAKAEGLFRPGPGWDKIVPAAQTHFITHHPLTYAKVLVRSAVLFDNNYISEMIGAFGFNHVVVPGVVIVSSIVCLLLAMLLQDGIRLSWKYTTTFAVAALAGAVLIATALYVTFSDVGYTTVEGLQGRYFLPLLPFFLGAIALALPAHLSFDRKKSQPFIVGLICVLLVGGLILSVLKYCYVTWG